MTTTNEPDLRPDGLPIMMTPAEVAELLHVNPSTLCRWRQTGTGPQVTWLSARMPRYQRRHVADWVEQVSR